MIIEISSKVSNLIHPLRQGSVKEMNLLVVKCGFWVLTHLYELLKFYETVPSIKTETVAV